LLPFPLGQMNIINLLCTCLLGADLFQILLLKISLLNLIKYTV
jgi:hypothetical protein